ncbi:MAG TPA: hypothetical protein VMB25_22320 [Bryobacteraceae bacterium]|nr:hypothetical protein [Bryobacteraceae bacterium]
MGAFNGNTLQTTDGAALAESTKDNTIPDTGSLNLSLIKTPNALQNTTGIDCKLVHGDVWEQIGLPGVAKFGLLGVDGSPIITAPPSPRGNVTINIHGNTTCTMNGNVTYTVQPYTFPAQQFEQAPNAGFGPDNPIGITAPGGTDGAVTFTVGAGGSFTETEFGPVTRTFMQTVNETYHTDLHIDQPADTSWNNLATNNSTVGETCFAGGVVFNFVLLQTDCYVVHGELTGVHAEFMPIHAEATIVHIATKDVKTYGSAFDSDTAVQANCKCEADAAPHQGPGHMPP